MPRAPRMVVGPSIDDAIVLDLGSVVHVVTHTRIKIMRLIFFVHNGQDSRLQKA